jgi:hypothetical protein
MTPLSMYNSINFDEHYKIYFKEGSEAQKLFGEFVYGKFIQPSSSNILLSILNSRLNICIEPRAEKVNSHLHESCINQLINTGVSFSEIDISKTEPVDYFEEILKVVSI